MDSGGRSEAVVMNEVLPAAEKAVMLIEISIRHSDEKKGISANFQVSCINLPHAVVELLAENQE
jgi:hypothetical protein